MPAHIDQNRTFQERLNDFGPELGIFLNRVWTARAAIDISSFDTGTSQIYGMYSGNDPDRRYSSSTLKKFVSGLKALAGKHAIDCQAIGKTLGDLSDDEIVVYGQDLWVEFFHVLSTPSPAKNIRTRVYVHAANPTASLELMKLIVGQFGFIQGLWEVKTCGPGATRMDTIVAYLYDDASRNALVSLLAKKAATTPGLFTDSLPPLVKREAAGIGSADEPPAVEIYKGGGTRHSFGSFYSTLTWIALKNTPQLATPQADGRHMLDNILYSLRLLRVDINNPQRFPEASALEQWYRASITPK